MCSVRTHYLECPYGFKEPEKGASNGQEHDVVKMDPCPAPKSIKD
jgi:hypothetical protein